MLRQYAQQSNTAYHYQTVAAATHRLPAHGLGSGTCLECGRPYGARTESGTLYTDPCICPDVYPEDLIPLEELDDL